MEGLVVQWPSPIISQESLLSFFFDHLACDILFNFYCNSVTKNYFENLVRALENGLSDVDSHGAACSRAASTKSGGGSTSNKVRSGKVKVIALAGSTSRTDDSNHWSCDRCTYANVKSSTTCQMCRTRRWLEPSTSPCWWNILLHQESLHMYKSRTNLMPSKNDFLISQAVGLGSFRFTLRRLCWIWSTIMAEQSKHQQQTQVCNFSCTLCFCFHEPVSDFVYSCLVVNITWLLWEKGLHEDFPPDCYKYRGSWSC